MKIMKVGIMALVAILGLALMGSSPAFATLYPSVGDSLIVSQGLGGHFGGGEFDVNIIGKGSPTLDFITFCLETNEEVSLGSPMLVGGISGAAIAGGSGGSVDGHDPIDSRTAFLYTAFTDHTLTDFGFDYSSAADANALQSAIWFIEEEVAPFGVTNHWVDVANDAIARGGVWEGKGLGDVRAINLKYGSGKNAQDLLTRVPEPSMMVLFGAGLVGLGLFRRRNNG